MKTCERCGMQLEEGRDGRARFCLRPLCAGARHNPADRARKARFKPVSIFGGKNSERSIGDVGSKG